MLSAFWAQQSYIIRVRGLHKLRHEGEKQHGSKKENFQDFHVVGAQVIRRKDAETEGRRGHGEPDDRGRFIP